MRILIASPQPFFVERGTPIAIKLLIQTLREQGHEVELLCYHEGDDPGIAGLVIHRAIPVPRVSDIGIGFSLKKLYCDIFLIGMLVRLLLTRRYDVIHAGEEAIFPAIVLGRIKGVRVVYDMDSSLADQLIDAKPAIKPLAPILAGFEGFAMRRAHAVLAVCEDLGQKVHSSAPNQNVAVIEDVPMRANGASPNVEDIRQSLELDGPIALYVGNLATYQGIDLLLDGVGAMSAETPCHVVVIGGAADTVAHYQAMAVRLGVDRRVHFLGARPLADLGSYLNQADFLLSPRISGQNTPMKIYSYMDAGKAILATRIRSHEQVLDETCGYLVEGSAQSVGRALDRLASDDGLRERLGDAAKRRVDERYSLPVFKERVKDFYDAVASRT